MKLTQLRPTCFRILKGGAVEFDALTVLIGTNASGKSTVLDALRFLGEGFFAGDFYEPVRERGGLVQIGWKGAAADLVTLETVFVEGALEFRWSISLRRSGYEFVVEEERLLEDDGGGPRVRLESKSGKAWWWTPQAKKDGVHVVLPTTGCALSRAAEDEQFPGRNVGRFIAGWNFFDPSPQALQKPSDARGERLDRLGRNLGPRLLALQEADRPRFDSIVEATRDVLGVPKQITVREGEDGRIFFHQSEEGLTYPVHQLSVSSGTLRMLAFMTALLGEDDVTLIGIEEPENYIHPSALKAFAAYVREALATKQVLVTTHSPLMLDCLPKPSEVRVVSRTPDGTQVTSVADPDAIEAALDESGFGLGEFFETKGFGA